MSNKVVTYIDANLNSIPEYWGQLVAPAVAEYRTQPSPRTAFAAALNLWHLHDWVWHDRNPGQDSHGTAFNAFRADLLNKCPELGWLRDLADASKHRGLGRLPEVVGAAPATVGGVLAMRLRIARGGRRALFLILNDGSRQDLLHVIGAAATFWTRELQPLDLRDP